MGTVSHFWELDSLVSSVVLSFEWRPPVVERFDEGGGVASFIKG